MDYHRPVDFSESISSGQKVGILYLDVEGGWGGSSRSLYYLIESLDRTVYQPIVLLRKSGPVQLRYQTLGVPCLVVDDLAAFRPAERKNLFSFLLFIWRFRRWPRLRKQLRHLALKYDVQILHVNHESLALVGNRVANLLSIPWIGHVRTQLTPSFSSRFVYRLMARSAAHIVFIVDPVRDHFRLLVGRDFKTTKTSVVFNIMPLAGSAPPPLPQLQEPSDRYRVLSLTNFSPDRGVDRILDVAKELKKRGDYRFVFYLCGKPAHSGPIFGRPSPYWAELCTRVRDEQLADIVVFPGHVAEPERALATCDALIKLTRKSNPWGRDILEALGAGLPIITLGNFDLFVENGVNGFAIPEFDSSLIADYLVFLLEHPERRAKITETNLEKARHLFDGPSRAKDIMLLYNQVLNNHQTSASEISAA